MCYTDNECVCGYFQDKEEELHVQDSLFIICVETICQYTPFIYIWHV